MSSFDPQSQSLDEQLDEKVQAWIAENEEEYESQFSLRADECRENHFMLVFNDINSMKVVIVDAANNQVFLDTKSKNELFQKFVQECNEQVSKGTPQDLSSLLKLICDKYKYHFMDTAGEESKFEDQKDNDQKADSEGEEWDMGEENEEYKEVINMIAEVNEDHNYYGALAEPGGDKQHEDSPRIDSYEKIGRLNKRDIDYFTNQVYSISKNKKMKDEALIRQYRLLLSSPEFENILKIDYDEKDFSVWNLTFDLQKTQFSHRLGSEFAEYAVVSNTQNRIVNFQMEFPENYPLEPPFIRLKSPVVVPYTGYQLFGGAYCLEGLSKSGWCPSRTLENIFVELLSLFEYGRAEMEKQGQLWSDMQTAKRMFQINEYQEGWARE